MPAETRARTPSLQLSETRTKLSFLRTQISADRTLMAGVRTSVALIGFGFTVNTAFGKLAKQQVLDDPGQIGRRLGLAVLVLGILLLAMAIASHTRFGFELVKRRRRLKSLGLLEDAGPYRLSPPFFTACLLLLAGFGALAVVVVRAVG